MAHTLSNLIANFVDFIAIFEYTQINFRREVQFMAKSHPTKTRRSLKNYWKQFASKRMENFPNFQFLQTISDKFSAIDGNDDKFSVHENAFQLVAVRCENMLAVH